MHHSNYLRFENVEPKTTNKQTKLTYLEELFLYDNACLWFNS